MAYLPTEKTAAVTTLAEVSVLIYGAAKLGKSTWASQSDTPLFFDTEAGTKAFSAYRVPITSWEDLTNALDELTRGAAKVPFKTLVFDTIDNCFKFCEDFVARKEGKRSVVDAEFGKGYKKTREEFFRVFSKVINLPYHIIFVSHESKETLNKDSFRIIPSLPKDAFEIITGMVDMIVRATIDHVKGSDGKYTTMHILRTRPTPTTIESGRFSLPPRMALRYDVFAAQFELAATRASKSDSNDADRIAKQVSEDNAEEAERQEELSETSEV